MESNATYNVHVIFSEMPLAFNRYIVIKEAQTQTKQIFLCIYHVHCHRKCY